MGNSEKELVFFTKEDHPLHEKLLEEIQQIDFTTYVGEAELKRVREIFRRNNHQRLDIINSRIGHVVVMRKTVLIRIMESKHGCFAFNNYDLVGYRIKLLNGVEHQFHDLMELYKTLDPYNDLLIRRENLDASEQTASTGICEAET